MLNIPSQLESKIKNRIIFCYLFKFFRQNDFIYNVGNFFYPQKEFMFAKSPEQLCHGIK